jgi:hypothetical protein
MQYNEKLIKETEDGYKIWENDLTLDVDDFAKRMFEIKTMTPQFRCYLMQFPPGNKEYVIYSFSRIPIYSSEKIDDIKKKIEEIYLQVC